VKKDKNGNKYYKGLKEKQNPQEVIPEGLTGARNSDLLFL
jgi:hypothetical protein